MRCDGAVDLEVTEHALDAVALAIESLVVADRCLAVRSRRDDQFDAAPLEVVTDGVGFVAFVGEEGFRGLLGKVDQRFVGLAVLWIPFIRCAGFKPGPIIPSEAGWRTLHKCLMSGFLHSA